MQGQSKVHLFSINPVGSSPDRVLVGPSLLSATVPDPKCLFWERKSPGVIEMIGYLLHHPQTSQVPKSTQPPLERGPYRLPTEEFIISICLCAAGDH